jgi:hypothetical protein
MVQVKETETFLSSSPIEHLHSASAAKTQYSLLLSNSPLCTILQLDTCQSSNRHRNLSMPTMHARDPKTLYSCCLFATVRIQVPLNQVESLNFWRDVEGFKVQRCRKFVGQHCESSAFCKEHPCHSLDAPEGAPGFYHSVTCTTLL